MNVQELYVWVNFMANKYQSGAITPDNYNTALQVVNIELLNKKVGLSEDYRPGMPMARQQYQITQKITDDLKFLIRPLTITRGANGYFALPANYAAYSSLGTNEITSPTQCGDSPEIQYRSIDVVTDEEFSYLRGSSVAMPTIVNPIANFYEQGLRILPLSITRAELTYLRYPATPYRNYTIVADEDIYNPVGSVQIEYPTTLHPDFAVRVAKYYGINIRDEELISFTNARQEKGE